MTGARLLLAAVIAGLLATDVVGHDGSPSRSAPTTADVRETVEWSAPRDGVWGDHTLGMKWNWAQLPVLEEHIRDAGGLTFFEVDWCRIEPTPGQRDWQRLDRVIDGTAELDYELMLKIRVGSCWATGSVPSPRSSKAPSSAPVDLERYGDFVRALVNRYRGVIPAYAIENEVNAENSWTGTMSEYGDLVRTAAAAVREVDPKARVLDSGLSSIGYGPLLVTELLDAGHTAEALALYQTFYARRLESGVSAYRAVASVGELEAVMGSHRARTALEAFDVAVTLVREGTVDAYQLHFYEGADFVDDVLALLDRRLPPRTPIEAWEIGLAWPGPSYDEERHAHETVEVVVSLLRANVNPIVYLPVAWTPSERRPREIWRGLVTPEGRARPAAAALRRLHDLLGTTSSWSAFEAALAGEEADA